MAAQIELSHPMPGDTDNLKKARKGGQKPRRGRQGHTQASKPTGNTTATEPTQEPVPNADEEAQDDEIGENVCHICAESMDKKLYAVAECNHRTCHACALRLRALYKKLDCTFCKASVIISIFAGGLLTCFSRL